MPAGKDRLHRRTRHPISKPVGQLDAVLQRQRSAGHGLGGLKRHERPVPVEVGKAALERAGDDQPRGARHRPAGRRGVDQVDGDRIPDADAEQDRGGDAQRHGPARKRRRPQAELLRERRVANGDVGRHRAQGHHVPRGGCRTADHRHHVGQRRDRAHRRMPVDLRHDAGGDRPVAVAADPQVERTDLHQVFDIAELQPVHDAEHAGQHHHAGRHTGHRQRQRRAAAAAPATPAQMGGDQRQRQPRVAGGGPRRLSPRRRRRHRIRARGSPRHPGGPARAPARRRGRTGDDRALRCGSNRPAAPTDRRRPPGRW